VGPRARRPRLTAIVVLACGLAAGCSGRACGYGVDVHVASGDAVSVAWTIEPSPPVAGTPVVARMTIRDRDQKPVIGARLRLEGLMSHPGMAPVVADVVERGEGAYEAPLQFTMAGDWILLVTGELPGGLQFKKQIEIAGVRPAS
jgi:predicted small secreted protein